MRKDAVPSGHYQKCVEKDTDPELANWSAEALAEALTKATAARFAELLVLVIGIAAHQHPDELRNALRRVFDLSGVENYARSAEQYARDARAEVAKETAGMREAMHALHEAQDKDLDELAARYAQASKRMAALEKRLEKHERATA